MQHGAKAQPLEERIRHHADGSAAEVVAFLVLGARLRHFHESRFLEQGYDPFYPALTYAGIPHDGAHVDVGEAAGGRRNAQAWLRIVSSTIWQASRRSERVWRFGCDSRGHFFGWKYHALARSAARDRIRGRPPLPFLMGWAGLSFGCRGSWPQRLPVGALIVWASCPQDGQKGRNGSGYK